MAICKEQIEKIKEAALWNFYNGLNCCESVYEAMISSGVLSDEDAPYHTCAMCAGFGGGVGMTGLTCGALSGAILSVSAKQGRKDPKAEKPDGLYDVEYRRYNNMVSAFTEAMGSPLCREICKGNVGDPERWGGKERKDHCANCITAGVEIACKYLDLTTEEIGEFSWKNNVAGF